MIFESVRVGKFTREEIVSQTWKWIVCLGYKTTKGDYQVEFVGRSMNADFLHTKAQATQQNIVLAQQNDLLNILEEFKTWRDIFKWEEYCLNRLQLYFDLLSVYPPTLEYMRRIYSIFPEKTELSLCVSRIPRNEQIFPFTIILADRIDKVYKWLGKILIRPLVVESMQDYRKITIFTDCIVMKTLLCFIKNTKCYHSIYLVS